MKEPGSQQEQISEAEKKNSLAGTNQEGQTGDEGCDKSCLDDCLSKYDDLELCLGICYGGDTLEGKQGKSIFHEF